MRQAVLLIFGLFIVLLIGCSGSQADSPVLAPVNQPDGFSFSTNREIWGMFDIYIDPDSDKPVTITPLRAEEFHVNIRKFLEEFPCTDCLDIDNLQKNDDGFTIDVIITHPFNNDAMTGFDVRGIVFFDGGMEFPLLGMKVSSPVKGDGYLSNPDGYTKLFNPTDYEGDGYFNYTKGRLLPPGMPNPDATLGPFIAYYSDGQSEDEGGRRAFFPGDTVTRTYQIVAPKNGPLHLGYAIDTSREPPIVNPPRSLDDFPISANCLEPFRIDVSETDNSLTSRTGAVTLELIAHDHQDPAGILSCTAEAPGLTDDLIVDDTPEAYGENSVRFELQLPNETGSADTPGEEVLFRILHEDSDPNIGPIPGWAFKLVDVEFMPEAPEIESIVPDKGIHDTIVDAVISGAGFMQNPTVRLYKGLAIIEAFDIMVTDQHTIDCSFYLSGPEGIYNLYIENTDGEWGELENAFEVIPHQSDCGPEFHDDTLGSGTISGNCWLQYDCAFLVDGPYEGMMIATRQGMMGNSLIAVDVDTTEPSIPQPFPDALGNIGNRTIWTLDVDEVTGFIFLSWLETPNTVHVYSSSGEPITSVEIGKHCEIRGLDHDGDEGFWVVFAEEFSAVRTVWHYGPDAEGPGFQRVEGDSLEVPVSFGPVQDLVVLPDTRIYILCSGESGTVLSFDISGSTPNDSGYVGNIFPAMMPIAPNHRNGDIEIDQTDPSDAFCRIVAYGRQPAGRSAVVKLDGDLNILNRGTVNHHYTAMAVNPDPDPLTHHLTMYTRETSYGTYYLLETPEGW